MDQKMPQRPHYAPGVPAEIAPVTATMDTLLFASAADMPERIAVDFLGRTFTYRELRHTVRKAQAALYRCGVRKGDVVALILPNCPQHVVAFYAALSLGATVAEHNPLAPTAELDEQLERHGAVVVIAWEQTLERLAANGDFRGRTYLSVNLAAALPLSSRLLLKLPVRAAREQKAKIRGDVPEGILSFDRIVNKAPASPGHRAHGAAAGRHRDSHPHRRDHGRTEGGAADPPQHHGKHLPDLPVDQWGGVRQGHLRGRAAVLSRLWFTDNPGRRHLAGWTLVILPNFDVPALLAAQGRRPITMFPGRGTHVRHEFCSRPGQIARQENRGPQFDQMELFRGHVA